MDIIAKFQKNFQTYRDNEERMGSHLKFVYDVKCCEVNVSSEECDCYDGYDTFGSPYYWSLMDTWENISIFQFAKLMEFYLFCERQFEKKDGITCYFIIEGDE